MSFGNDQGYLETGECDFSGETSKLITLSHTTKKSGIIILSVFENQDTSAGSNTETDIPARNVANLQVSAYWVSNNTFYITSSAEFYGRVNWFVQSKA